MKNFRSLYLYAVCLICVCTILINTWTAINAISNFIWPTEEVITKAYYYREIFTSSIMIIISSLIFIFHWKRVDTKTEQA